MEFIEQKDRSFLKTGYGGENRGCGMVELKTLLAAF